MTSASNLAKGKLDKVGLVLDLETTSTQRDAGILTAALAMVNYPPNCPLFMVNMYTERGASLRSLEKDGYHVAKKTMDWWRNDAPKEAYDEAFRHTGDINTVLDQITQYILYIKQSMGYDVVLFGNGATFDVSILEHAYRKEGREIPWHGQDELCFRTIKRLHRKAYEHFMSRVHDAGDSGNLFPHHPLYDAEVEACALRYILSNSNIGEHALWDY